MWQTKRIGIIFSLVFIFGTVFSALAATESTSAATDLNRKWAPDAIDWTTINELDLKTAAHIALAGNPSLAAAEARVRQAMERVTQAKADYWPRLDLTAAGAKVWLSDNDLRTNQAMARLFDPNATLDDPEDRYNAGLIASWKMFDGFARKFSNAAARYGQDQTEAALDDGRRLILSAVATAYFAAQLTRENVDIAKADEEFNQRQLVEAEARRRVGTGSLSDQLNFEIRINDARASRIRAERNYEAALYALAALLGLREAAFPPTVQLAPLKNETEEELDKPDAEALIVYAHKHRPDIRQSQFGIQQADARVEIARSRFYPDLNLSAGYDGTHTDDLRLQEDDFGASVGLSLSYNLFSGGADRARVKEAQERAVELEKIYESQRITVSSEIRDSLTQLLSAQEQLRLQRINAKLVQTNRELVDKEYNAGQASLVRLNEAQRDLVTAQGRLALALATLRQAWFNLETDTGHILKVLADAYK
jgi:outer membrane protein